MLLNDLLSYWKCQGTCTCKLNLTTPSADWCCCCGGCKHCKWRLCRATFTRTHLSKTFSATATVRARFICYYATLSTIANNLSSDRRSITRRSAVAVIADRTAYDVRYNYRPLSGFSVNICLSIQFRTEVCFWCPSTFSPFVGKRRLPFPLNVHRLQPKLCVENARVREAPAYVHDSGVWSNHARE